MLCTNRATKHICTHIILLFRVQNAPRAESDIKYEFNIRSISGPIVAFESIKFPGHFMSMGRDGVVKLEGRNMETNSVQFIVRVHVSEY